MNVARCWTVIAAALGEVHLSDDVPAEWKSLLRRVSGLTPPETLRSIAAKDHDPQKGAGQLRKTVEDLRERIPLLRETSPST